MRIEIIGIGNGTWVNVSLTAIRILQNTASVCLVSNELSISPQCHYIYQRSLCVLLSTAPIQHSSTQELNSLTLAKLEFARRFRLVNHDTAQFSGRFQVDDPRWTGSFSVATGRLCLSRVDGGFAPNDSVFHHPLSVTLRVQPSLQRRRSSWSNVVEIMWESLVCVQERRVLLSMCDSGGLQNVCFEID